MRTGYEKVIGSLLRSLIGRYRKDTVELVQIKAAALYIKAVAKARQSFIGGMLAILGLLLLLAGFVLIHLALLILLPWSMEIKAIGLLVLGGLYFLVPLIFILAACSERRWMRLSQASKIVRQLTQKE
jgi:NADH:ubiquinone oxidoreductase subunit 3 (subunit A)